MKRILSCIIVLIFSVSFVCCTSAKNSDDSASPSGSHSSLSNELIQSGLTQPLNTVSYSKENQYFGDSEYLAKLSSFSSLLYALSADGQNDNYVMSPLSAYMALSILWGVGDDGVKSDIQTLFNMTEADIMKTADLFKGLVRECYEDQTLVSKLDLTNSIWLDTTVNANPEKAQELADDFFCYAYKTPFSTNNQQANADIREFIKNKTNRLIDQDFGFDPITLFAIINTLYFKDVWGSGMGLATCNRLFSYPSGARETEFLYGNYVNGEVVETQDYSFFYAHTFSGYKVKFIVPTENKTLSSVMTKENLDYVNGYDFHTDKSIATRCIFPSFKITSDTDLKEILSQNGYLQNAFSGYTSDLVEGGLAVSDIIHKAVFNADKDGVEGAAVTIIVTKETAVAPPHIEKDFVIDKNFGFIVTTFDDVVVFSGQVINP